MLLAQQAPVYRSTTQRFSRHSDRGTRLVPIWRGSDPRQQAAATRRPLRQQRSADQHHPDARHGSSMSGNISVLRNAAVQMFTPAARRQGARRELATD
jgi:hypothetical protein